MTHSHFTSKLNKSACTLLTGLLVTGLICASFGAWLIDSPRSVEAAPIAAPQAVIVVTTNADDAIVNGNCTLREALQAANTDTAVDACAAGSGVDTITFAGDYTITLGSTLTVIQSATLDGSGHAVVLDGNNAVGVMNTTAPITLRNLTIQNGGGVSVGGGLYADGGATIENVAFLNNQATLQGGGLYANAAASIANSTFTGNQVTVNTPAAFGGAVRFGSEGTIVNSTFTNNSSANYAGAIGSEPGNGPYLVTISGSTFISNTAQTGGAIITWDPFSIANSTFSGNTATGGTTAGGALSLAYTTNITNVTISGSTGSGIQGVGPANLFNTIIANALTGSDCGATLGVNIGNLIQDGTCSPSVSGDPLLGPLANNGGSTQTFALLPGSPALDAGDNPACTLADQRGVARPQNGTCDIGAFESTTQPGPNFTVNAVADTDDGTCEFVPAGNCTLREAINAANTRSGADTITFVVSGTISLGSTLPFINETLTVDGTGRAIALDGNNTVRVLVVGWSVPVTVTTLSITNGLADTTVGIASRAGGGILNLGTLTVMNSTFSGNAALDLGGGIGNVDTLTVINSTFAGNSAPLGGGIYNQGTMTVRNSTLAGNSAGGGITRQAGAATLYNTLVANNAGGDCAGGVTADSDNLDTNGSCGNATHTTGVALNLGLLANNGGSTWTFALLPGSPAINAGDNAICPATDQRGITRPQQGTCDIGAFESRGFTLTKASGDNQVTPRNAVFTAPLVATISSAVGEPVNGGQVSFIGPSSGPGLAPITNAISIVNGVASASVTANGVGGGPYTVTASAQGAAVAVVYTNLINNSTPVLTPIGDQTTPEDVTRGPITLGLSDADSPIGDLTLTAVSANPALIPTGNITFGWSGPNRTMSLTSLPNQFGSATITLTVSDAFTNTRRVFNFIVTPVNDAPTTVNLSNVTVAENQPVGTTIGTLSAVDVEPGDTHTFALVSGSGDADNASFQIALGVLKTNAIFNYEARNAYFIRLRATDNGGLSVERPFTITIANANDAPIAQPDYATTIVGQSVSVAVLANDSDPDANPLQLTNVTAPMSGTTNLNGSNVLYTPLPSWVGTVTFTYTVSDGQDGAASALVTVLINPPASPQVIIVPDVVTTTEDMPIAISPLVNDSAPQSLALVYVGPSNGGTAAIQGVQALFTPTLNFNGVTTFTYSALAGTLGGGQAIVTVNVLPVNDPPVAASDSAATPEETAIAINVLANDVDVEGNPITVVSVGQGAHGLVQLASAGVVTYTPSAGYHGSDQFAYIITDGQGGTASGSVNVTVIEVNRPPLATRDDVFADEDAAVTVNVIGNDTDPNTNDSLQVVAVTQAQNGTVTLLPSGSVQYMPDADYHGADNFAYLVADSGGLTGTASVSLTVRPVLDPPVPNPVASATSANQPASINVLSETVNADGQPLVVTSYTQPPSGNVSLNPDGTFLFTPTIGFEGLAEFTYTLGVSGTLLHAPNTDRVARVTIAVGTVTSTASIADETVELTAGSRIDVVPLANVQCQTPSHSPHAPHDLANLVLIGLQRRIGLAAANPNGTVTYTPLPGFSGTDVITYTASDGAGCFGTGVITLTVAAALRPPSAIDDLVAGTEDTPLTIDVTANDYDLSGGPITVTAASQPVYGQVQLNANGTLSYTPPLNFYGIDRMAYTLVNQQGIEGMASVYVVIANVNDPPVARDDIALVQEDTPTIIAVRANDVDPDGDLLTVTTGQPAHGSVNVTPLGTLLYRPVLNFNGTDVLTYTINDGHGGVATATLSINIAPVNDPPIAITDTATITAGQSVQITVLANDSDVDSTQLLLTGINASNGTASISGSTVWYTPAPGPARTDMLTYLVADEQGGQAAGTIVVTILETLPPTYRFYFPLIRR